MQAVHDHHATYPLIKKPTNRLLLTFSPDFALNSQIWLFYAEKWIFLKKLGTLLTATGYIVEQSPFATAQRLDTVNSNAVLANGIILRCIYAVVANNIRCKNLFLYDSFYKGFESEIVNIASVKCLLVR